MQHQAMQRRAVIAVVALLQRPRFGIGQAGDVDHVVRDQQVDLREEIALTRIERVVEIEDPVGDVGEVRGGGSWDVSMGRLCQMRQQNSRLLVIQTPLRIVRDRRSPGSVEGAVVLAISLSLMPVNEFGSLSSTRRYHVLLASPVLMSVAAVGNSIGHFVHHLFARWGVGMMGESSLLCGCQDSAAHRHCKEPPCPHCLQSAVNHPAMHEAHPSPLSIK